MKKHKELFNICDLLKNNFKATTIKNISESKKPIMRETFETETREINNKNS